VRAGYSATATTRAAFVAILLCTPDFNQALLLSSGHLGSALCERFPLAQLKQFDQVLDALGDERRCFSADHRPTRELIRSTRKQSKRLRKEAARMIGGQFARRFLDGEQVGRRLARFWIAYRYISMI